MEGYILVYFEKYEQVAFVISILLNVIIAVLGVIPSFFLTAANLVFFGFWKGTLISFIGESAGAMVAFYLYRKGFRKMSQKHVQKYPRVRRLLNSRGKEAFFLVFSLRLLPFVPSSLVTFAAAIGNISFLLFAMASTIGKIPALLIEAYSVYQVTQFEWQGKIILSLAAVYMLYSIWRRTFQK
ncbi:putative membrane protein YdjX (TVP38/TMEM64 family) [Caldalkalibacillus uzonensis]|uniref:TVP38/TMEM64 family membrane protein n=1 Tax=Caldalkalibacillus uzonensis TaxID=353224 RepID=A0ABU0CRS5_9BACI|nr:VTT domain-containing protein [Caldalkalibacillus uzonensis]MDQ0339059.1 putative membrane protein YdjX (TVP38/TMEM64 family) [Caldalkalibacillus uzonensis]